MIEFRNVRKVYSDITALDEVSFRIEDGEFVFIVGRSGAGKTTVTRVLLLEEKVNSGQIFIGEDDITTYPDRLIPLHRRRIGMVFQDFRLFPDKTAYENVAFAMRAVGTPAKEIRQRVPILLKMMQVEDKASHFPPQLSGGERQRVALARALANNPDIIVADEPTGNVDPEMSLIIMNLLKRINTVLGKTVIVVTHERALVDTMGERVITIDSGRIASDEGGEAASR
ncbi:MAG: ATP-binding cassette domain-containing protein [Clostridiales bacterium]|nr:ATP-binding cassette domain-containing protein [Clostridiales bacterium]